MTCECCWADRYRFQDGDSVGYNDATEDHERRGCVCAADTLEGRKARAGRFWDDATQTDTRLGKSSGTTSVQDTVNAATVLGG